MNRNWNSKWKQIRIEDFVGMTFTSVSVNENNDEITFEEADGRKFLMFHDYDCCENVSIESITGDLRDLVGARIQLAEEVSSEGYGAKEEFDESFTWTFYKLATRLGYVDIRWYGESNGYYSERVDLYEVVEED